jgi:2-C-methyl-D-erythritol 4-phosphate cytidylyltransferase/2-C-methyl-D-erythritol 2,4-cyclodiphosphate synthase
VLNADLTLLAEAPRIGPHREAIRSNVARLLALPVACVNLKATTTEHLGFVGRAEGLAAMATVLIDAR